MSVRGKSMMKIILVIVYLILTTLGVVLMKKGGNPGSLALEESTLKFGISIVSAIGLLCYICSFLLYKETVLSIIFLNITFKILYITFYSLLILALLLTNYKLFLNIYVENL